MRHPDTRDYSEISPDYAADVDRAEKSNRPTFLLRRGRTAAVILGRRDFQALSEAREFMEVSLAVEESRRQFEAGQSIPWEEAKRILKKRFAARAKARSKPTSRTSRKPRRAA